MADNPRLIDRAADRIAEIDAAYARGEIDDAQWHSRMMGIVVPAYLAADNPRAQSGSSRDAKGWERARRLVCDAIHHDGTLLDIGCANGHLMECLTKWCNEDGHDIEAHGLEIAPALAELAQERLPDYADRIYVGNAMNWEPPQAFDFVRTNLEYVPPARRVAYLRRWHGLVAPGGRLIVGPQTLPTEDVDHLVGFVASTGLAVDGKVVRSSPRQRACYALVYVNA